MHNAPLTTVICLPLISNSRTGIENVTEGSVSTIRNLTREATSLAGSLAIAFYQSRAKIVFWLDSSRRTKIASSIFISFSIRNLTWRISGTFSNIPFRFFLPIRSSLLESNKSSRHSVCSLHALQFNCSLSTKRWWSAGYSLSVLH